jgi:ribonuclease P protein component
VAGDEKSAAADRGEDLSETQNSASRAFRFPKSARLTRTAEFFKVKDKGQSFHGRFIVLSVFHLPETESRQLARIGLITSRRVGPAVTRNRVRRRLRELSRLSRSQLRDGVWLVLVARASAAKTTTSFQALQQDWNTLARRARIFRDMQIRA